MVQKKGIFSVQEKIARAPASARSHSEDKEASSSRFGRKRVHPRTDRETERAAFKSEFRKGLKF